MPSYDFYVMDYMGDTIPAEDFAACAARAEQKLRHYKRIYTVTAPDDVSELMAVCAMADTLYYFAKMKSGGILQNVSVGSVSESYSAPAAVDVSPKAQEKELYRSASIYLDIYRGCGE